MLKCWQDNPTDRPTFVELSEIFENLLEEHVVRNFGSITQRYKEMGDGGGGGWVEGKIEDGS